MYPLYTLAYCSLPPLEGLLLTQMSELTKIIYQMKKRRGEEQMLVLVHVLQSKVFCIIFNMEDARL